MILAAYQHKLQKKQPITPINWDQQVDSYRWI